MNDVLMKVRVYQLCLILITIFAVGVVASSFLRSKVRAQAPLQPYTLLIRETTTGLISGSTLEKIAVKKRKSDGSRTSFYLDSNNQRLKGQIREVVLANTGRRILVDDTLQNVSTFFLKIAIRESYLHFNPSIGARMYLMG
jgi:hypothetical protein